MYRPPPSQQNNLRTTGFLTEWAEFLSHQTTAVAELIIVGDLNIHLDNNELHYSQRMQQTIESCGLQQHIDQATHYLGHTLDILITRDTSNIVAACEVRDIGLCDNVGNLINGHFAEMAKICCSSFNHKHQEVTFRRYKEINVAQFRADILASPSLTECSGSTDELVKRYITGISALINTHAPLIHRTIIPRPNAPWYTETVRDAKHLRRTYERKWRRSDCDADKHRYRVQCTVVAKEIYNAKAKYYSSKIEEYSGNPKMLYKLTDALTVNKQGQQLPSNIDDSQLSNNFCEFFEEKINNIRQSLNITTCTAEEPLASLNFSSFRPATSNEIRSLIMSYGNKFCALDPLPTWLLKQCIDELLPLITSIINNSMATGTFPSELKNAIIVLLLKNLKLDHENLKNFRPVANLHFLSKLLEKLVVSRLDEHLVDCSLYDPLQSAYRKNHSTETVTLKLCNDVITGLDLGHCTLMASLDLSAAFDTVDHTIFLRRLQTLYCVNGTVIEWFKSYLRHRQHKVSINGILSTARTLKCGVPQGSVLGARMYSMYVKPLSDIMNRHNVRYHTYADDIQLYITCENNENSIEEALVRLQDCISEISVWMSQNALKINEDKTKFNYWK